MVLLCNRKDCTKTKGSLRATAKYSLGKIEEQRYMALAVQHLDWLMFWSDTDEIDPVWVGRAIVVLTGRVNAGTTIHQAKQYTILAQEKYR